MTKIRVLISILSLLLFHVPNALAGNIYEYEFTGTVLSTNGKVPFAVDHKQKINGKFSIEKNDYPMPASVIIRINIGEYLLSTNSSTTYNRIMVINDYKKTKDTSEVEDMISLHVNDKESLQMLDVKEAQISFDLFDKTGTAINDNTIPETLSFKNFGIISLHISGTMKDGKYWIINYNIDVLQKVS